MKTTFNTIKKALIGMAFLLMAWLQTAAAQVYPSNESGPGQCDGWAFIDSTQIVTNTVWAQNGVTITSGDTYMVSGLCAGTYTVTYSSGGQNFTFTFVIGTDTPDPCAGFAVTLTSSNCSSANVCDGSLSANIYGGTAPYTYNWGNGTNTLDSLADLCPGSYQLTVTDQNGCVANSSGTVSIDGSNVYDTVIVFNNGGGANVLDSLQTMLVSDCDIDFTQVTGGAITNVYGTADSLVIEWTIYGNNGVVLSTYLLPYWNSPTTNGNYAATLIVICGGKLLNSYMVQITDVVELNLASVNEEILSKAIVCNPFTDEIRVQLGDEQNYSVAVMNMNGQTVVNPISTTGNVLNIPTAHLSKGVYFVQLSTATASYAVKVVKH
ncbi:MAG: hypothetical protein RL264_768 [Bacteroidota bacterium]|jgi:hypothetical protein